MAHQERKQAFAVPAVAYTQAELATAQTEGTLPPAGTHLMVLDNGGTFKQWQESTGPGSTPAASGGGVSLAADWAAATDYAANQLTRATVAVGTVDVGDILRRKTTGTSGAMFNVTEAAAWDNLGADLVRSVAGKSGVVTLAASDVGAEPAIAAAGLPIAKGGTGGNTQSLARTGLGLGGAATLNVGAAANTVAAGDDARLSNARTPTSHASSHAAGGADAVTPAGIGAQAALVSGTNIKTLNGQSVLGGGNIAVGASSASVTINADGAGGTVAQVGNDRVHTFTADGTFTVPTGVSAVRVLAVAGGGGGGAGRYNGDAFGRPAGGGGAGGLIHNAAFAVTPGATIPVTVGLGGAGATDLADTDNGGTGGSNGGNSVFGSLSAIGGGGGGGHYAVIQGSWDAPANVGGSGGGGSNGSGGAAGTAGQGFAGGSQGNGGGSGGGGAGGAGGTGGGTLAEGAAAGAGGIGASNDITGSSVVYAAGGASSGLPAGGIAGVNGATIGGGGSGATKGGNNGLSAGAAPGGGGANGIVIVRYLYQSLDTPIYASNAAAIAGGLTLGQLYRTGADPDTLCVVH